MGIFLLEKQKGYYGDHLRNIQMMFWQGDELVDSFKSWHKALISWLMVAQSAGAVEYTDCFSEKGWAPP